MDKEEWIHRCAIKLGTRMESTDARNLAESLFSELRDGEDNDPEQSAYEEMTYWDTDE